MTSFAVLLAPLTVGTLADATSLTAALGVVPVVPRARGGGLGTRAACGSSAPPTLTTITSPGQACMMLTARVFK